MTQNDAYNKRFFAKLMLFGEYSIIHDSSALAIPYERFSGELRFQDRTSSSDAIQSNQQLKEYALFLNQNNIPEELGFKIHTELLLNEIDEGLYFDSNIPEGYGVGSSGALIAALYDRYAHVDNPLVVRKQLAFMEHYFHGKSSGIDPLVAYLNKPLLIEGDGYETVEKPDFHENGIEKLVLLDTGQVSKTAPLVENYLSGVEKDLIVPDEYISNVNEAIKVLHESSSGDFLRYLYQISQWQFENLQEMIPHKVKEHWRTGLINRNWIFKLCGSGGGGFLYIYVLKSAEFEIYMQRSNLSLFIL